MSVFTPPIRLYMLRFVNTTRARTSSAQMEIRRALVTIDPVRNKITAIRSELAEIDDSYWESSPDWEIVQSQLKSLIESDR